MAKNSLFNGSLIAHINSVARKVDKSERNRLSKSIDASYKFSPKSGSRTSNNREASLNKIVFSKFKFYEPEKYFPYNFDSNLKITQAHRETSLSKSSLESLRLSKGSSRKKSGSKKKSSGLHKQRGLLKHHGQTISVSFDKRPSSALRHGRNKTATHKAKSPSISNF